MISLDDANVEDIVEEKDQWGVIATTVDKETKLQKNNKIEVYVDQSAPNFRYCAEDEAANLEKINTNVGKKISKFFLQFFFYISKINLSKYIYFDTRKPL